ncbi:hypothetical protein FKG94_05705 [Exilibacterium tricleocarpae]|uniref:Flagellar protein FliT n=1 Tax=Exilibacterium tricleocarpae TaxID=2591008 RepID=A0A545U3U8_9GAMM|nr:hypothetical protein [Exilibacterium tricleocarpae]TQV84157.1 hypothetical protein FKG94_05705 [Exilibacterium tricleocarpae]
MAVIPITQLALQRSKRQLHTALQQRDWHDIKRVDLRLAACLESAATDPHRDRRHLLHELREILGLYGRVVETCRSEVNALVDTGRSS